MLPFFAKLSEQIKEKVYSLLVAPGLRDAKRKRQTNEMDAVNINRGPKAKKMKIIKSEEEESGGDAKNRQRSCFNNNHEAGGNTGSEEVGEVSLGGDARNPSASGKQEDAEEAGNESPLKALLSIKKEHGGSGMRRPGARNPYSIRNIHNLGSTRVVDWTEDQLEILRSALAAYRYSPRTTRDRVFWELRQSHRRFNFFTKEDVGNWLKRRCDYDRSQRWLSRKRKIEEIGEIEVFENKKNRKIRFSEETRQKYFSTLEITSVVAGNHDVVYVPLKE